MGLQLLHQLAQYRSLLLGLLMHGRWNSREQFWCPSDAAMWNCFSYYQIPNHYTCLWRGLVLRLKWDYFIYADALQLRAKSLSVVCYKYDSSYCFCGGRVDLQKWGWKLNTTAFLIIFLILLCLCAMRSVCICARNLNRPACCFSQYVLCRCSTPK